MNIMEKVTISCPDCNQTYKVGSKYWGSGIVCKVCQTRFTVPFPEAEDIEVEAEEANSQPPIPPNPPPQTPSRPAGPFSPQPAHDLVVGNWNIYKRLATCARTIFTFGQLTVLGTVIMAVLVLFRFGSGITVESVFMTVGVALIGIIEAVLCFAGAYLIHLAIDVSKQLRLLNHS